MRWYANKQNWRHYRTHIEKAYGTLLFGHIAQLDAAVPAHQAYLISGDEHFSRMESGYQLEEPAGSIQENMDLSDSGWYWYVNAHLLGCLHTSWPWKRDATVSEDYALMMMMISNTRTLTFDGTEWPCLMFMLKAITQCRESDNFRGSGWIPVVCPG